MKQNIKCYFAVTSRLYRILILLVFPAITVAVNALIKWISGDHIFYGFSLTSSFLLIEIAGNYLLSGGIASRQTEKLGYLKSSARGEWLLKNVMCADMVRRFLYFLLELICVSAISEILPQNGWAADVRYNEGMPVFFGLLSVGYFYGTFGIMIVRFFDSFRATLIVWYLSVIPVSISCSALNKFPSSYVVPAIYLLLSILASIFSIWLVIKRLRSEPQ